MLLRRIIYSTVVVLAVAATWFEIAVGNSNSTRLPSYLAVPDFKLTERSGKIITLADLKGKVWVANVFYASCPGPCPVISGHLSALQDDALKSDDVRFVSISSQPDTDTPAALRQYADRFHASDKWLFLTGDKAQIFNFSNNGLRLGVSDQTDPSESAPIIHSTQLVLVDKAGNIRGYYDGMDDAKVRQLADDIKKLLHE